MSTKQGAQPQPWPQRLPPSPVSSRGSTGPALSEKESLDASSDASDERRAEKAPHDASVFVGSLPSNIDHIELTRMLAEHLSEHTQVKSIKVIRDSKGGVCAFVQCEDAQAACTLIQTLRSVAPKPFLGRILRFEPARAFRALLISYRAPSYIVPGYGMPRIHDTSDLPTAMRIWKPHGARAHNIVYNADAVALEAPSHQQEYGMQGATSLYLQPLMFDEASVHKMAAYFGRLEKIEVYQSEEKQEGTPDSGGWKGYPNAHGTAPRLPCMDQRCWEVKWDYRDDCVGALMALRRIPHLTVTWAHQPHSSGSDLYHFPRPQHIRPFVQTPYVYQPPHFSPGVLPFPRPNSLVSQPTYHTGIFPHSVGKSAFVVGPSQEYPDQLRVSPMNVGVSLSEKIDLPAASTFKELTTTNHMPTSLPQDVWTPQSQTSRNHGFGTVDRFHQASMVSPKGFNSNLPVGSAVALSLPETPKTKNVTYPLTPTRWSDDEIRPPSFVPIMEVTTQRAPSIDPTSLFVGGLDVVGTSPWTEKRVRDHFSKYGVLENVKFVRPFDAVTAFAFLKFNNTEGPARAVLEEHNRVSEGRVLRVQLRDCNPPRNPWKYTRGGGGRGRYHQNHHPMGHRPGPPQNEVGHKGGIPVHLPVGIGQAFEQSTDSPAAFAEPPSSPFVSEASPTSDDRTLHDASPTPSLAASDGSEIKEDSSVQDPPEKYREWYDDLETVPNIMSRATSTPSTASMSIGPPLHGYPYVFQNNGTYYAGGPAWMPTHAYQSPYQVSYYPVYPPQSYLQGGEPDVATGAPPGWSASGIVYGAPQVYSAWPQQQNIDPATQRRSPSSASASAQDQSRNSVENLVPVNVISQAGHPLVQLPPGQLNPQGATWAGYGQSYFPPSFNGGSYESAMNWHPGAYDPRVSPNKVAQPAPPAFFPNQIGGHGNQHQHHTHPPNGQKRGNRRDHYSNGQRNQHHRSFNGKQYRAGVSGGSGQANGFVPQEPGKGKHHLMNRG